MSSSSHDDQNQKLDKCGTIASDGMFAESDVEEGDNQSSDVLQTIARQADLFLTPDRKAYADMMIGGHRETMPLESKQFKRWLRRRYRTEVGVSPRKAALEDVLDQLKDTAEDDGVPVREVFVRVGRLEDKIYLDLCEPQWRAVEVDTNGWRVIESPPVRFHRGKGMLPLPYPIAGGSIDALRPLLNVKCDTDYVLAIAFLLDVLNVGEPFPVLVVGGRHDSAKSTFTEIIKSVIDPKFPMTFSLPEKDKDMFIAANNAHVLAFDNVSYISSRIADLLCRISYGAGYTSRKLWSDDEESTLSARRPLVLNGIGNLVNRSDLADRTLLLSLEPIKPEHRRDLLSIRSDFKAEHPSILGALLDAAAHGLSKFAETPTPKTRMAEFARWVVACETAIWPPGTFMGAYTGNLAEANKKMIELSMIARTLRDFMANRSEWEGTPTQLWKILGERAEEPKNWFKAAHVMSGELMRMAPNLQKIGIEIVEKHSGITMFYLTNKNRTTKSAKRVSTASKAKARLGKAASGKRKLGKRASLASRGS